MTHLAILYADHRDRQNSPGVPVGAIVIFADRRYWRIKSLLSAMSGIGDLIRRHSPSVPVGAIVIFADRRYRRIKSLISAMSDIGDLIRRFSPSVPVSTIFYGNNYLKEIILVSN